MGTLQGRSGSGFFAISRTYTGTSCRTAISGVQLKRTGSTDQPMPREMNTGVPRGERRFSGNHIEAFAAGLWQH